MAVRTIQPGTWTQFGSYTNLNSLANGAAKPLGVVDNSTAKKPYARLEITVTLASSSVSSTGYIDWYLIRARQNTGASDWTDGISPTTTSDIASSLKNARIIRRSSANANNQVVKEVFHLPVLYPGEYWTIVPLNGTGAAFASSGNDARYSLDQDAVT